MKKYIVLFTVSIAFLYSANSFAKDTCSRPDYICDAIETYKEGLNASERGKWRKAADYYKESLKNWGEDGSVDHDIFCSDYSKDDDNSYIPTLSTAHCPSSSSYYPNKEVRKIKKARPPVPQAIIVLARENSVEAWSAKPSSDKVKLSRFEIANLGMFEMQEVKLRIIGQNKTQTWNNNEIDANSVWKIKGENTNIYGPIKIEILEKDGYGLL